MRGRLAGLFQSPCGEANKILLASALSSMRAMCLNRASQRAWIITAVSVAYMLLQKNLFWSSGDILATNNSHKFLRELNTDRKSPLP